MAFSRNEGTRSQVNQSLAVRLPDPLTMVPDATGWLVRLGPAKPHAALKLFCFTYAGGSAMDFREWPAAFPETVELHAVQLPGRGMRFHEQLLTGMNVVVDFLLDAVKPHLDRPFALFGHSLGGRIAFALAQRLDLLGHSLPRLLAVSASRAPGFNGIDISGMSDGEFHRYLTQLGGTSPEVLANQELKDLVTPVIRADFMLHDSLVFEPRRLPCPILACGGREDRSVSLDHLQAWGDRTSGGFHLSLFPGNHFYLRDERHSLVRTLIERLGCLPACP